MKYTGKFSYLNESIKLFCCNFISLTNLLFIPRFHVYKNEIEGCGGSYLMFHFANSHFANFFDDGTKVNRPPKLKAKSCLNFLIEWSVLLSSVSSQRGSAS